MSEEKEEALTVALSVNDSREAEIYEDDIFILTVTINNTYEIEAESERMAIDEELNILEQEKASKKIDEKAYQQKKDELELQKPTPRIITLGSESEPWYTLIKFYLRTPEGEKPLEWSMKIIDYIPTDNKVVLDASTALIANFEIDEEEFKNIPRGEYRIVAKINDVESEEEIIVRLIKGSRPDVDESNLFMRGSILLTKRKISEVLAIGNKMLSLNPSSIGALILIAEAHEVAGNIDEALNMYYKALDEFEKQYPDDYEGPTYIQAKIVKLEYEKRETEGGAQTL